VTNCAFTMQVHGRTSKIQVANWRNFINYLILLVRLVRGCHLLRATSQEANEANGSAVLHCFSLNQLL